MFEAEVEGVTDRKITTVGRVRVGDDVTVEARGLFIEFEPAAAMKLADAAKPGAGG